MTDGKNVILLLFSKEGSSSRQILIESEERRSIYRVVWVFSTMQTMIESSVNHRLTYRRQETRYLIHSVGSISVKYRRV